MQAIIDQILKDATAYQDGCHGIAHWDRVAEYARIISIHEKFDGWLLRLFAYFHDCQRLDDGRDLEHGPRAADYLMQWTPEALNISEDKQRRLEFACRYHTCEIPTEDRLIRACWDCDRLDIGRVGIAVDTTFLFTDTAKRIAETGDARRVE